MMVGTCPRHGEWNAELAAACPRCVAKTGAADDARAQLWARVYAVALGRVYHEAKLDGVRGPIFDLSARRAREEANTAVADFDEHYLGGKR